MRKEKASGAVTIALAGAMALSVLLVTPDIVRAETVPGQTTVQTGVEQQAIQEIPGEILARTKQKTAEMREDYWDYEKEWKEEQGAFTYYGFSSRDGQEAWVYEITVDGTKNHSILEVPDLLDGKRVTYLGYFVRNRKIIGEKGEN